MIERRYGPLLRRLLRRFPSVTVLGPRQCGKTTFIRLEIKLHSAPTAQDAETLYQCMRDLKLARGYLIHSGREHYSLGHGITALSAEKALSRPQALFR